MTNRQIDRDRNAEIDSGSDVVYVSVVESESPSAEGVGEAQLESTLHASFEADPLEDGTGHLAEDDHWRRSCILSRVTEPCLLGWLRAFSPDVTQPSFAASVLRCLGRLSGTGHEQIGAPSL